MALAANPASGGVDAEETRERVRSRFDAIDWAPGRDAEWRRLSKGFVLGAQFWPAGRPATPQSALDFATRLQRSCNEGTLGSFFSKGIGGEACVVGDVALAAAGCDMTENAGAVMRGVSVFLSVKNAERWRIADRARDVVDDIPATFAAAARSLSRTEKRRPAFP